MAARRGSGRGASPRTITLPAVLDLAAAAPLADTLRAIRGGPVSLDASSVERLGGQCLQVLLSAKATWDADAGDFVISAPSGNFLADLGLLGLSIDTLNTRDARP